MFRISSNDVYNPLLYIRSLIKEKKMKTLVRQMMLILVVLIGMNGTLSAQITVVGAASDVNGTYDNTFSFNGKPAYERSSGANRNIIWRSDVSEWRFTDGTGAGRYYYNSANTATPPDVGWLVGESGVAPAAVASGSVTSLLVGDGTSGAPYQISSLNGLYWIAQHSSSWDKYYIQTADIDASETSTWSGGGWTPIGNWPNSFTGSYDGNLHTIQSLYINRASENQGLFGRIRSTGGVYDLGLTNVNIICRELSGALSGDIGGGITVDNCYSTGSITESGVGYCGGLIGYSGGATILNSYSECVMTSSAGYHVGGLIGYAEGTIIEDCRTTGDVAGGDAVGGLVGSLKATSEIRRSYSTSDVTGTGSNSGGLVGVIDYSTILTSFSRGMVNGKINAGGLVGYLNQGTLRNCYSHSNVTIISSWWGCGGLVGNAGGLIIEDCYSIGTVTISGVTETGGLLGYQWETTINTSFWDTQTSGTATSASGTGKTTAEMKNMSTFNNAGWDGSVWFKDDGVNNDYPYLAWENPSGSPMPVEIRMFTAVRTGANVELKWITATEKNNFGFEIERRATDNWCRIGFVEGNGTTNAPSEYSYADKGLSAGRYSYRLKQVDRDGNFTYSQEVNVDVSAAPSAFVLQQNYPNPFNPATMIRYQIPVSGHVTLNVYDAIGREVASLVNEVKESGAYSVMFNGSVLSSGVYVYTLRAGTFTASKMLMLMK